MLKWAKRARILSVSPDLVLSIEGSKFSFKSCVYHWCIQHRLVDKECFEEEHKFYMQIQNSQLIVWGMANRQPRIHLCDHPCIKQSSFFPQMKLCWPKKCRLCSHRPRDRTPYTSSLSQRSCCGGVTPSPRSGSGSPMTTGVIYDLTIWIHWYLNGYFVNLELHKIRGDQLTISILTDHGWL